MGLGDLIRRKPQVEVERADPTLSFDGYLKLLEQMFSYQGLNYSLPGATQEDAGGSFVQMSRASMKASSVVFACMDARAKLFSEARFQFRPIRGGRPGDLFGTPELLPLETPWAGATTGDLLARAIQYADLAGNAYFVRRGSRLTPLRPDWVSIIGGVRGNTEASVWHVDAEVLGFAYTEGGPGSGNDPEVFLADEIAHFAPIPDPEARFRGMSWLTPVIREVMADKAATDHKLAFFENGGTPNLVVKLDAPDLDTFERYIDKFRQGHEGISGAYKTMFLASGSDATVVGSDLKQLDFKVTQGAGETRIAAAAGVPPIVVGLSEGLQAATYSNYGQARRRFADNTMRPLWRNAAGSLAQIINVPAGAELWYDDRDIQALQEDAQDDANIRNTQATAIRTLLDAGFVADTAVAAVTSGDFGRLKHSGLFSVQLQPPGTQPPAPTPPAIGANGARAELLELALWNELRSKREPLAITMPEQSPPVVNVTVERQEAPDVNVTVPPQDAPQVNVTVEAAEPAQTHIHEGAFRSETTVQPTQVEIAEGAVRVENTVLPPNVSVQAAQAPDVNVTVEPARVDIAEGAVRVDAPPPAEVTVNVQPELRADLSLTADAADALRQPPNVTVNVEPTPVTVENTVNVPETPVNVTIEDGGPVDATIDFKRDRDGKIKSAKLTETEGDG